MFRLSLVQLAIWVVLIAAVVALMMVALRHFGTSPPGWVVQVFWIVVVAVVVIAAIVFLSRFAGLA